MTDFLGFHQDRAVIPGHICRYTFQTPLPKENTLGKNHPTRGVNYTLRPIIQHARWNRKPCRTAPNVESICGAQLAMSDCKFPPTFRTFEMFRVLRISNCALWGVDSYPHRPLLNSHSFKVAVGSHPLSSRHFVRDGEARMNLSFFRLHLIE